MNIMAIPSFSDYGVDMHGNVYELKTNKLVSIFSKNGKRCVNLYQSNNGIKSRKMQYVSRLVAEAFIPAYSPDLCVIHLDGNTFNDSLYNLQCVTKSEALRNRCCTTHSKIIDENTGETFCTYADAARSIGGHRNGVYLCAIGIQSHHKGHRFKYVTKK